MNASKKYEMIMFDFDGPLANSLRVAMEENNHLRSRWPSIPEVNSQDDMTRLFSERLLPSLTNWLGSEEEAKDFFNRHSAAVLTRTGEIHPFPIAAEAIRGGLGIPIVLITSAYTEGVEEVLGKHRGMTADVFDLILDRSVGKSKAEKIEFALERFKVNRDSACYIGDLAHDILESRKAGVDIASVGYGYHPAWYLRRFNPDHILETEDDFATFLRQSCRTKIITR